MDTGALVGLLVGLFGVALGLAVPVAMWLGTFSRWTAIRPEGPLAGHCDADTLRSRLLALNDPDQPFTYGANADHTLTAEWRIADATWHQFFARCHATERYRATLSFVAAHREVRVLEERTSLRQGAGEMSASRFQGIVLFERSAYREWVAGPPSLVPREAISFDFDVRRIKGPLIATVLACGWTWVPVVLRSHLSTTRQLG